MVEFLRVFSHVLLIATKTIRVVTFSLNEQQQIVEFIREQFYEVAVAIAKAERPN